MRNYNTGRTVTLQQADAIAEKTKDAYSFDLYGHASWVQCCRRLAQRGFTEIDIEDIMRSKLSRWAGEKYNLEKYNLENCSLYTSSSLIRFLNDEKITPENIQETLGPRVETRKPLEEPAKKHYVMQMKTLHKEGHCPCCDSTDLNYEPTVIEGHQVCYPYACNKCGFCGEEWHNLTFDEHTPSAS